MISGDKKNRIVADAVFIMITNVLILPQIVLHNEQVGLDFFSLQEYILTQFVVG